MVLTVIALSSRLVCLFLFFFILMKELGIFNLKKMKISRVVRRMYGGPDGYFQQERSVPWLRDLTHLQRYKDIKGRVDVIIF